MIDTLVRRSGFRLAALLAAVTLVASCSPLHFTPGGGVGSGTCLAGTWKLDAETIVGPTSTPFGSITITASGTGVALTLTDTTWSIHADQTLDGAVTTPFGTANGSVHVVADTSGTYTSTASQATFTLTSVSGTADYTINVFGNNFSGSASLPTSGLQKFYGLSGTANYTCDPSALSLTFPSFSTHSHH